MKKPIINIAREELRILFCSPVAWIVLVVFVFEACSAWAGGFEGIVKSKAMGYGLRNLTDQLFNGPSGVYTKMLPNLYLYIPLLTMGVMSRELGSGSIKLLYSSPVTNRQIILGKYLGIVGFCLIMLSVFILFGVLTVIFVESAGVGVILSGFLGLFLLMCTYAAIGLFISSMTSYQVAAATGTLALLALLNLVGSIGQGVEWVRDLTYWLSIGGRASDMTRGLIASDDAAYFLALSGLFLTLSILRLRLRRRRKSRIDSVARYAAAVCLFVGAGYVCSLPGLVAYHDTTSNKSLTLTPASREVMSELEGGMTITTYVNILAEKYFYGLPANVNADRQLFRQYVRFKPDIRMKYVYYYDHSPNPELDMRFKDTPDLAQRARMIARGHRLRFDMIRTPDQMRQIVDLSGEENRFVRRITTDNGRSTFLRIFDDMNVQPSEREITAAMKRLTGRIPVAGFLAGHGERSPVERGDRDYNIFATLSTSRASLINQGFDAEEIFLREGAAIPGDVTALIVADVSRPLEEWEISAITEYIDRGGNMIFAVEPGRHDYVTPIADHLGIRFGQGVVVCDGNFGPDVIPCRFTPEALSASSVFNSLNERGARVMVSGSTTVDCNGAGAKGFDVMPVAIADAGECWNETESLNFAAQPPRLNEAAGESRLDNPAMIVRLTREIDGRQQCIMVMGDADCISNGVVTRDWRDIMPANYDLVIESFRWFTGGEYPISTPRAAKPDNDVTLLPAGAGTLKIILVYLLPLLLAAIGSVKVILRQRN